MHNWCEEVSINYHHLGSVQIKDMMKNPTDKFKQSLLFTREKSWFAAFFTLRKLNNVICKSNTYLGFFQQSISIVFILYLQAGA